MTASISLSPSDEDYRGGSVDQDLWQTLPEALFLKRRDPNRDLSDRVAHVLKHRGKFKQSRSVMLTQTRPKFLSGQLHNVNTNLPAICLLFPVQGQLCTGKIQMALL